MSTKKKESSLLAGAKSAVKNRVSKDPIVVQEKGRAPVQNAERSAAESSQLVSPKQLIIDPADTGVWAGNPRNQDNLSYEECKDVIDGLLSVGRQHTPAIVRLVKGAPYKYEVLVGTRRRWSVNYLREHGHPDFGFLVEVQSPTDTEAFLAAISENKDRKPISDYELAVGLKSTLSKLYGGVQVEMANALGQSESSISRQMSLSRCPEWLLAAYPAWADLKQMHCVGLLKMLGTPAQESKLKEKVADLAGQHQTRREAGKKPMSGAEVFKILTEVAKPKSKKKGSAAPQQTYGPSGNPHLVLNRSNQHALTISLPLKSGATKRDLVTAFNELLEDKYP